MADNISESDRKNFARLVAAAWADDALTLRRADDSGKAEGLAVEDLAHWVPLLHQLSERAGGAEV